MIISHKYKFIFVKTFKTAGSSFEAAYSWISHPDDVLPPDEPCNQHNVSAFRNWQEMGFYNHMHACDIQDRVSPMVWRTYYKFCFERNPWDKAVSWYYWHLHVNRWAEPPTLSEFILKHLNKPDWPMYTKGDSVIVDKVFRFENLLKEIGILKDILDLPEAFFLPRVKGDARPPKTHYYELLGEAERDKVAQDFSKTIKLMGYKF